MRITTAAAPPFFKNGYIVACEHSPDAVIIDPGDEVQDLLDTVKAEALRVKYILLTHAHLDHITGVGLAKSALGAPIWLHRDDLFLYEGLVEQGRMFGIRTEPAPPVDAFYEPGQRLTFGDLVVDAKSGVSGAGREAKPDLMFGEVNESVKAYGLGGHRHVAEIEQELAQAKTTAQKQGEVAESLRVKLRLVEGEVAGAERKQAEAETFATDARGRITELEKLLGEFADRHPQMAVSWIRPCLIYGPAVDNYLSRMLLQYPLVVLPDGCDVPQQYVHEDDVAHRVAGPVPCIGGKRPATGPTGQAVSATQSQPARTPGSAADQH